MNPAPRRTQVERRNQSENALLKAAVDVIASGGVNAVTFEALGRIGGFSRGLATARFGSKKKLIEAVLGELHKRQEILNKKHGFDDMAGLMAVLAYVDTKLREMVHNNEARAYYLLLSSTVAENDEMRCSFASIHTQVERRLLDWVTRGQAEGSIRSELDPAATALMIGCLLFGISMQLLVDPSIDIDRLRDTAIASLQTSLASSSPVS